MRLYLFNPYFEVSPSSDYLFDFSPHGLNPIVKASEKSRFHSFIHSFSECVFRPYCTPATVLNRAVNKTVPLLLRS